MIYLDYNATTPINLQVLNSMKSCFEEDFANPASDHSLGLRSKQVIDQAREGIASFIGAKSDEIIFTGCATESNNIALLGVMHKNKKEKDHVITTKIEHPSILNPCKHLEEQGFKVTYLSVDKFGMIDLKQLGKSITERTALVSVIFANNEIGTIQNMKEIGEVTKRNKVYFHTDASQSVGHIPINVDELNIDLMSISAHKFNGPKGVGALFIRGRVPRVRLSAVMFGGGQERGLRSGTLNVPLIVGMSEACKIAKKNMKTDNDRLTILIDRLKSGLLKMREDIKFHGHPTQRIIHNLNIEIPGINNKWLTLKMQDFCFATGSACSEIHDEPSHVLLAIGLDENRTSNCIRISIGSQTTESEISQFLGALNPLVIKDSIEVL